MSNVGDEGLRSSAGRVGPADDRPLTEQEFQLLQRLLSDPFSFPIQYKTWLVSYLETSDLSLPISAIQGLTAILGIAGVGGGTLGILPAGIILPFGGVSAPQGSLLCNGASYSRIEQDRLWKAIGGAFGTPNASTFNVPDIQERVPVGRGVRSGYTAVGQSEGRAAGARGVEHHHGIHNHGLSDPGHHHAYGYAGGATQVNTGTQVAVPDATPMVTGEAATGITLAPGQVGSTGDTPDRPAFIVLNFIIVN